MTLIFQLFFPAIVALISMGLSQIIKIAYFYFIDNKIDFSKLKTAGGLPSSHSAMVTGLSSAIGLQYGWLSPYFQICIIFAFVVIYDAIGIRQAVGEQACILNEILKKENKKEITELLGHTPFEVLIGCVIGISTALLIYNII